MNGNDTFLDVNDAHLRVTSGNVYASAFNLDQIDIVMSSNTASTVNFNNPTKAFNAASNIEVGTANLFVDTTTTRVGVGTASPATTLDVAGDLNVSGNLTIIGTTTTLDTEHLTVKDPIIELGKGNTASPVVDLGLVMTRPSGSSNVGIIFDESAGRLEIGYTQGSASDSTITMDSAPLSVNVNGTISGNGSGLTALNAAATLTTPRTIGGVNFDGSADIVPTTFGAATFDTDTLVVDSVNDRVGVGTTTPLETLDVYGGFLVRPERTTKAYLNTWSGSSSGSFDSGSPVTGPTRNVSYSKNAIYTTAGGLKVSPPNTDTEYFYVTATYYIYGFNIYTNSPAMNSTTSPYLSGDVFSSTRFKADNTEDFTGFAIGQDYQGGDALNDYSQSLDIARAHSAHMYFKTASPDGSLTEKMRITNAGNVGIGTASPSQKFVVMGDSAIIHSNSADTHNTIDRTLYIGGREVNGSLNQSKCAIVSTPSTSHGGAGQYGRNALHFCVGPDAQNNTNASKADSRMCIDYTGNVGIGTTNPQQNLHVHEAGSGQVVIAVTNDTTGSGNNDGIHFGIDSGENGFVWHKPNTHLKFATDNTERMRVDSGTTVTVAGGTAGKGVSFAHAGIAIDRVWSNYPSITVMNENSTGDTNQSQLRVHGCNVSYSSYPNTSGSDFGCSIYIDGTYQTNSDRRFKTNITTIDNALDKVLSLSGKRYQLLNVDGNIRTNVSTNDYKYGFIAQDLQELGLDETYIHYSEEDDGTDGYNKSYSVDYDSFIPLLVNAIKEQTVIINNIKDQLELERDRNDDLEARILALENAS